mgnify:CR=1 FL=1
MYIFKFKAVIAQIIMIEMTPKVTTGILFESSMAMITTLKKVPSVILKSVQQMTGIQSYLRNIPAKALLKAFLKLFAMKMNLTGQTKILMDYMR